MKARKGVRLSRSEKKKNESDNLRDKLNDYLNKARERRKKQ